MEFDGELIKKWLYESNTINKMEYEIMAVSHFVTYPGNAHFGFSILKRVAGTTGKEDEYLPEISFDNTMAIQLYKTLITKEMQKTREKKINRVFE